MRWGVRWVVSVYAVKITANAVYAVYAMSLPDPTYTGPIDMEERRVEQ